MSDAAPGLATIALVVAIAAAGVARHPRRRRRDGHGRRRALRPPRAARAGRHRHGRGGAREVVLLARSSLRQRFVGRRPARGRGRARQPRRAHAPHVGQRARRDTPHRPAPLLGRRRASPRRSWSPLFLGGGRQARSTRPALGEGDLERVSADSTRDPSSTRSARRSTTWPRAAGRAAAGTRGRGDAARPDHGRVATTCGRRSRRLRAMVEAIDDGVVDDPRACSDTRARCADRPPALRDGRRPVRAGPARRRRDRGGDRHAPTRRDRRRRGGSGRRSQAEEKGLHLVSRPDGVDGIMCSPRLARVLQNLLVNAVRHTPADGTVRVEAAPSGRSRAPRGPGHGRGHRGRGYRAGLRPLLPSGPARRGPGPGLGLALAKRIVEALGGRSARGRRHPRRTLRGRAAHLKRAQGHPTGDRVV